MSWRGNRIPACASSNGRPRRQQWENVYIFLLNQLWRISFSAGFLAAFVSPTSMSTADHNLSIRKVICLYLRGRVGILPLNGNVHSLVLGFFEGKACRIAFGTLGRPLVVMSSWPFWQRCLQQRRAPLQWLRMLKVAFLLWWPCVIHVPSVQVTARLHERS